ncbi:hypothetical protein J2Y58_004178 [Sphingomonas sp. BE138]|nr:hypothetical protein [Sphingomonas sp. BE138]MDR6790795.1 hypothetical protein [Sphingomonas sp. BE138]
MAENVESTVELKPGETEDQRLAEMIISPNTRAAFLHYGLSRVLFGPREGKSDQRASFDGMVAELEKQQAAAGSGDMRRASDLLITQAHVLDALFGDFMHRALDNAGSYPDAMQRYMGMALKAQAQSRASIEALARIHQPREQVVRHVHVNEGGQAIVADQVTIGGPGGGAASIADQSHAARAGGVGERTALPSPDPLREGMPVPSGTRKATVQNARRDKPRRSARQQ